MREQVLVSEGDGGSRRRRSVPVRGAAAPSRVHVPGPRHLLTLRDEPRISSFHRASSDEERGSSSSLVPANLGFWVSILVCAAAVLAAAVAMAFVRKNKTV